MLVFASWMMYVLQNENMDFVLINQDSFQNVWTTIFLHTLYFSIKIEVKFSIGLYLTFYVQLKRSL
jgi:hypothetical protein